MVLPIPGINAPIKHESYIRIIFDRGSTDGTLNFYSENCIEVLYLPKGNMYKAINFGLGKFDVEWISYINSDDILNAEAVMDAIDKYSESADIIYGDTSYIDHRDKLIYRYKGAHISLFDGLFLNGQLLFSQSGTIIRANIFAKIGGFLKNIHTLDLDFFVAAYLNGVKFQKYKFNDLASFRMHDSQITKLQSKAMKYEIQDVLSKYQKVLNEKYFGLDSYINKLINLKPFFSRLIYLIKSYTRADI